MHLLATAFTALSALTASCVSLEVKTRQSAGTWHVSKSYAGCGRGFCSYQFHVTGQDTGDLPYFEADCMAHNGIGDTTFRQCQFIGAGGQQDVEGDFAYVALYPRNRFQSKLVVQLKFSDEGKASTEYWQAEQDGQYQTFSQDLQDFDVVPGQAAAVA